VRGHLRCAPVPQRRKECRCEPIQPFFSRRVKRRSTHLHAALRCECRAGSASATLWIEEASGHQISEIALRMGRRKINFLGSLGVNHEKATSHALVCTPSRIAPGLGYSTATKSLRSALRVHAPGLLPVRATRQSLDSSSPPMETQGQFRTVASRSDEIRDAGIF